MNKDNANLTDDVLKAISVLNNGDVAKKSKKDDKGGDVNLLSIVEKVSRNRKKGQESDK